MRLIGLLLVLTLLTACSLVGYSTGAATPSDLATTSHLAPAAAAAVGAVWLENLCEDPEDDAYTLSTSEAIADMFLMPVWAATYVARFAAYATVGVGMVSSGVEAKTAIDRINKWLPVLTFGPNPDKVDVRYSPPAKGCFQKGPAPSVLASIRVRALDAQTRRQLGYARDVQGVVVVAIERDSRAARAGLQHGDVIQEITAFPGSLSHRPISDLSSYQAVAAQLTGKHQVVLTIRRQAAHFVMGIRPASMESR